MTLSLPNKTWLKNLIIAGSTMLLMTLFMVLFADKASAHGYVDSPGDRAILCKQGQNTDCGAVVYEPQSLKLLKAGRTQALPMAKSPVQAACSLNLTSNPQLAGAK